MFFWCRLVRLTLLSYNLRPSSPWSNAHGLVVPGISTWLRVGIITSEKASHGVIPRSPSTIQFSALTFLPWENRTPIVVRNLCPITIGSSIDGCNKFKILGLHICGSLCPCLARRPTLYRADENSQTMEGYRGQCLGTLINLGTLLNVKRSKVSQEIFAVMDSMCSPLRCSSPICLPRWAQLTDVNRNHVDSSLLSFMLI